MDVRISLRALILGLMTIPMFFVGTSAGSERVEMILESFMESLKESVGVSASALWLEEMELNEGEMTSDLLNCVACFMLLFALPSMAGPE